MLFVYLLSGVVFGGVAASVAANRGRNQGLWFFACFLLAGLPLLLLLVLPNEKAKEEERFAEATKQCPKCAERVKKAAVVCRFCGYEFPVGAVARAD